MNEQLPGMLLIALMFLFYVAATRHARRSDLFTQLTNTLREMEQDAYVVYVGRRSDDAEWVELINTTTRIRLLVGSDHEELTISLFLPKTEPEGTNLTHLMRMRTEKSAFGEIKYRRTNTLRGVLLYHMEGLVNSRKGHGLFDALTHKIKEHRHATS